MREPKTPPRRRQVKTQLIVLAAVLLASCAKRSPGAQSPAVPEGQQPSSAKPGQPLSASELEAAFAREAQGLKRVIVKGPGGAWTAEIEASGEPVIKEVEGLSIVEAPIGGSAKVRCQVLAEEVDPGDTIGQLLGSASEKVQFQRVAPWAIHVVAEAPAIFVDALYHAPTTGGKVAGELKIAMLSASAQPVLCMHDEPGYRQTFERVTMGFFQSLKGRDKPQGDFVELQIATLDKLPVGFHKVILAREGAARQIHSTGLLMLPVSQSELRIQDEITIETLDEKDRLNEGTWVEASGGAVTMKLQLKRVKGALYRYEGDVQGKKIAGELRAKEPAGLPSTVTSARALAKAGKKAGAFSLVEHSYNPDIDPTKLSDTKYFRKADEPASTMHIAMGSLEIVGEIDEQGLFKRGETPVGAAKLTLERGHLRGKL
jgi:hypothetical protein